MGEKKNLHKQIKTKKCHLAKNSLKIYKGDQIKSSNCRRSGKQVFGWTISRSLPVNLQRMKKNFLLYIEHPLVYTGLNRDM